MKLNQSTIAAIATGPSAGGVGIIRISGPRAVETALAVAPTLTANPKPRHAYFCNLAQLDDGVVIYFQTPNSYTGEDVVELMPHGSPRLLSMLLEEILKQPEVRLADPGEFTRRAFLNGRIDLARAEAVAELVAAQSEAAVRSAAAQLSGALSQRIQNLKESLLPLYADLEASLDFPEEAEGAEHDAVKRIDAVLTELTALTETGRRGTLARRGAHVVLYGPVNAGKSTLFNALVDTERALVDAEPGTTRDVLETTVELSGFAVTFVDTAGLREGKTRVEALGIEKARTALAGADVALLVAPPELADIDEWRKLAPHPNDVVLVASKCDVQRRPEVLNVSARTREGIAELKHLLMQKVGVQKGDAIALASERHREALSRSLDALNRARTAVEVSTLEVVAGEIGVALRALDEIVGQDASTELLDTIFSRFCIGK